MLELISFAGKYFELSYTIILSQNECSALKSISIAFSNI